MLISDWSSDVCSSDLDLAVLKHLAGDSEVAARGGDAGAVARLWDVCGLPDFEQLGAEHHRRTIFNLSQWRTMRHGMIDPHWFARPRTRFDDTAGDYAQPTSACPSVPTLCSTAPRDHSAPHPARRTP